MLEVKYFFVYLRYMICIVWIANLYLFKFCRIDAWHWSEGALIGHHRERSVEQWNVNLRYQCELSNIYANRDAIKAPLDQDNDKKKYEYIVWEWFIAFIRLCMHALIDSSSDTKKELSKKST